MSSVPRFRRFRWFYFQLGFVRGFCWAILFIDIDRFHPYGLFSKQRHPRLIGVDYFDLRFRLENTIDRRKLFPGDEKIYICWRRFYFGHACFFLSCDK